MKKLLITLTLIPFVVSASSLKAGDLVKINDKTGKELYYHVLYEDNIDSNYVYLIDSNIEHEAETFFNKRIMTLGSLSFLQLNYNYQVTHNLNLSNRLNDADYIMHYSNSEAPEVDLSVFDSRSLLIEDLEKLNIDIPEEGDIILPEKYGFLAPPVRNGILYEYFTLILKRTEIVANGDGPNNFYIAVVSSSNNQNIVKFLKPENDQDTELVDKEYVYRPVIKYNISEVTKISHIPDNNIEETKINDSIINPPTNQINIPSLLILTGLASTLLYFQINKKSY